LEHPAQFRAAPQGGLGRRRRVPAGGERGREVLLGLVDLRGQPLPVAGGGERVQGRPVEAGLGGWPGRQNASAIFSAACCRASSASWRAA